jgi:hypothetical protein
MLIRSDNGFPDNNSPGRLKVANSVARVVESIIPGELPYRDRPIYLFHRPQGPLAFWQPQDYNADHYRIGLKVSGPDWQKTAYQLSHELAHLKFGPPRTNLLVEVFAIAVSIKALSILQDLWARDPPFSGASWPKFSASIAGYTARSFQHAIDRFGNSIPPFFGQLLHREQLEWLEQRKRTMINLGIDDETSRAWQYLAANILFEMEQDGMASFGDLHGVAMKTDPSPVVSPACSKTIPLLPSGIPDWVPTELR